MGFGGGAFGTGSYLFNTIDNITIKLDELTGVIHAVASGVETDLKTILVNSQGKLTVNTAGIVDNTTTIANSNNQIVVQPSGFVAQLVDNATTKLNSNNQIEVQPSGFIAQLVDNSTTKVNSSNQISVIPSGIVSSLVDNATTEVNSSNQIAVKTSGIIDNSTIKVNSSGLLYAVSQTPALDNNTIYLNSNNQLAVKPSSITQTNTLQNITISSNTTLTSDLYCNNLTINSGVVLTTNGYNIYCTGTFKNNGTINTGLAPSQSFLNSFGGSGGGGGANFNYSGSSGLSTLVSGGSAGTNPAGNGGNGSTPSTPTLSNSLIQTWYKNGFSNYLAGAGGGNGAQGIAGGSGSYGIYIQANQIIAGSINAIGENGTNGGSSGGGGGGGGGVILLAYGSGGYTAGTYNVSGGSGGSPGSNSGSGGTGGNGQVLTYNYSSYGMPINIASFNYTSITGILNRNSSFQYVSSNTTSTSPTTIISQSFTPEYTGLVKIKAVVQVWNNTAGDGVFVGLYNGSIELDSETLISNTANQQQIAYLYNEVLYSAPFSQQAFSIQFNAVNGGTAYAEIQEFTIEEVY